MTGKQATLIIKNPASSATFSIEVPLNASLLEVQKMIAESYEGKPQPQEQTIIFAGKVLKDPNVTILQLVEKHVPIEGPHNFHLVVKQQQLQQNQQATSQPPPRAAAAATAASTSRSSAPSETRSTSSAAAATQPGASTSSHAGSQAAAPTSAWGAEPGAEFAAFGSADATAAQMDPLNSAYPYMFYNPVAAAAYQVAYNAAYAAALAMTSAPSGSSSQDPAQMREWFQQAIYNQGMYAGMAHYFQNLAPAMSFYGIPPSVVAHALSAAQGAAGEAGAGAARTAPITVTFTGLRQRRGAGVPAAAAAHAHQQRPRRQRVFTLRISARTVLQVLVFAMVLYQHFTLRRFVALVVGGLVLYLTASWAPLRRFLLGMTHPPEQRPAAQPRVQAADAAAAPVPGAAQPADQGQAQAAAQAPANPAQAAPAAPQRPQRGILQEIAVVLIGFLTSLLPAWNYNPEDAAAFAAAQEMIAREERARQQAAGGAAGEGAGAEAAPGAAAGDNAGAQDGGPAAAAAGHERGAADAAAAVAEAAA
mmetsp:Transcript_31874/g.70820  ORF Transcript_31874/g.70820 Transcript_31874/m.70820 type:complete len:534 (-) Transcript_31874:428-2029(-)|eukprot:CAMPEP_0202894730 /NCGR_PEP_ID=MMETSP1392-20130828/4059_1 /ASSEMBLY_ACC=CAM_ASM_000868 /TAXON_ID=225041 /ORGANISM="Chlamydomonas chlamydogama, Strain SAG 11-48b" /LENGTH=533 /DNA_ID=CAMNT_0049579503 /DNA_START=76 /DNA_END=1677 /DNA_ORIENTATION=+